MCSFGMRFERLLNPLILGSAVGWTVGCPLWLSCIGEAGQQNAAIGSQFDRYSLTPARDKKVQKKRNVGTASLKRLERSCIGGLEGGRQALFNGPLFVGIGDLSMVGGSVVAVS